jgi:ABC-type phosphate transport system substrate-binding protein
LYLVTKGKPEGLVNAFVRWVLVEGQEYVDEVGYVALPREKLDAELGKLE